MRFTLEQVAEATGGRLTPAAGDGSICGATIDSRDAMPESLFVPILAERDGHDFVPAAIDAGATAYLTSVGPIDGVVATAVELEDTAAGLSRLGAAARARIAGPVIGVTGSVGKTSVKDLIAGTLGTTFAAAASHKSFNNELGVPLTLVNAPDTTEAAVIEMGARGRGHIADLCEIAEPTIGVVTMVGAAHTELFGTIDDVAVAKGELIEALPANGTAVLNADVELVAAMAGRAACDVVTFGRSPGASVTAEAVTLDDELRPSYELVSPWGRISVRLGVRGEHNVTNSLGAAAASLAAGVPIDAIADGLAVADLSPWRMELSRARSGAVLLNDAYNANPMSMRAALDSLAALDAERRVAVLGVMAELGDRAADEHREIAARARELGIELVAYGTDLFGIDPVEGIDEAQQSLGSVDADVAILVKGSRVAGLERLADALTQ